MRKALLLARGRAAAPAIVPAMYDDDYVSSELYRLAPPRKRIRSGDLGEALDAVRATGGIREALGAANGTGPGPADDSAVFWPATRQRQWPRRLGRFLARVDTWTLIVTTVGVIVGVPVTMDPSAPLKRPVS